MAHSETTETRRLEGVAGALLGLVMVLLIRRYGGINHDAPLYLGQALLQQWPDILGADLFFAHGSQGSYTVFPRLLALGFALLDPPLLFLVGSLVAILFFAWAGWYALAGILPPGQRYWAWLGVLCLPSMYGRTLIFSYHEAFLTPRPLAEALCLVAVGLLARSRWLPGLACLTFACLFHPLQAIAAALVIWPWLVARDRRWLHLAWLAVPVLLLAWLGVQPFGDLFRRFDAAWLSDLHAYTGQLFVLDWSGADYANLALDGFLLVLGWRTLWPGFRAWCMASLAGLVLGLLATLVAADWLHLVLPTGLQPWRAHWVAHWLAMATIGLLLQRDLAQRDIPRAACLTFTVLLAWGPGGWIWLPPALLYATWASFSSYVQPRLVALLGWLFLLGAIVMLASHVANEYFPFRMAHFRLDLYAIDRRILSYPLVALGLPLLGVAMWTRCGRRLGPWLVAGLLCPLLALGAVRWDARSPLILASEANAFQPDLFGEALPRDAQVYWDDDTLLGTWLTLERASYLSPRQLSGLVFNRGTAEDARGRLSRVYPILSQSRDCQALKLEERERCRIDADRLLRACGSGPTPPPDYLVLPYRQPQRDRGSWSITDPATGEAAVTYWLYACPDLVEDIRAGRK